MTWKKSAGRGFAINNPYASLIERIHQTWPCFDFDPSEIHSALTPGWDYQVVFFGEWVLRMGRTRAANTRLQYEMSKLETLSVALPIPHYEERCPWGGLYRKIPGDPVTCTALKEPAVQAALHNFVNSLHDPKNLPTPYRMGHAKARWRRRYQILEGQIQESVLSLLTTKQQRRAQDHFRDFFSQLSMGSWEPALLHGDLSCDHILVDAGKISGIIDFGDLMVGDPAFDWSGWESGSAPDRYRDRIRFYRWVAPTYQIRFLLEHGTVEEVERLVKEWIAGW